MKSNRGGEEVVFYSMLMFLVIAVFGVILHFYGMTPALLWVLIGIALIVIKYVAQTRKA